MSTRPASLVVYHRPVRLGAVVEEPDGWFQPFNHQHRLIAIYDTEAAAYDAVWRAARSSLALLGGLTPLDAG